MKRLIILLLMLFTSYLFADVWQIKAKANGTWRTQTISKEEFVQLLDNSKILSVTESSDSNAKIKNYSKTVSYEISTTNLTNAERVKLVHYYQRGE